MSDDIEIDAEQSDAMEEMAERRKSQDELSFEIGEVHGRWNYLRNVFLQTVSNDDIAKKFILRMMAAALTESYAQITARELGIEIPVAEEDDD